MTLELFKLHSGMGLAALVAGFRRPTQVAVWCVRGHYTHPCSHCKRLDLPWKSSIQDTARGSEGYFVSEGCLISLRYFGCEE